MRADWLQAFLTFSQTMNFTRAAAELNISQPALHVKAGKLAEWAGQPLYRKVGRNLVLTPAGEMVAAFAREERERLQAFTGELRAGESSRPVVLCAEPALTCICSARRSRAFLRTRPTRSNF